MNAGLKFADWTLILQRFTLQLALIIQFLTSLRTRVIENTGGGKRKERNDSRDVLRNFIVHLPLLLQPFPSLSLPSRRREKSLSPLDMAVIDDERYVRVINQSPQEEKKGKQGKKEKRERERKKKTGASAADASQ